MRRNCVDVRRWMPPSGCGARLGENRFDRKLQLKLDPDSDHAGRTTNTNHHAAQAGRHTGENQHGSDGVERDDSLIAGGPVSASAVADCWKRALLHTRSPERDGNVSFPSRDYDGRWRLPRRPSIASATLSSMNAWIDATSRRRPSASSTKMPTHRDTAAINASRPK